MLSIASASRESTEYIHSTIVKLQVLDYYIIFFSRIDTTIKLEQLSPMADIGPSWCGLGYSLDVIPSSINILPKDHWYSMCTYYSWKRPGFCSLIHRYVCCQLCLQLSSKITWVHDNWLTSIKYSIIYNFGYQSEFFDLLKCHNV